MKQSNKFHAKKSEYNGIKFDSKLEVKYAKLLDAKNIKWERCKEHWILQESFIYKNNKIRDIKYTADFIIYNEDGSVQYQEIKGKESLDYKLRKKLLFKYLSLHPEIDWIQIDSKDLTKIFKEYKID